MAITKIKVENLTVFEEMEMNVESNVNVIIGENGTGKTHLLKFIYMTSNLGTVGLTASYSKRYFDRFAYELLGGADSKNASSEIFLQNEVRKYVIKDSDELVERKSLLKDGQLDNSKQTLTFIPAKDMLTHSKGFLAMARERKMPFDETLIDVVSKASIPELREYPIFAKDILPRLESIMDGIVVIENDEFFILKKDGRKVSFSVEAEGVKKIGLLWKLIMTGNIAKDAILLWDEPEANMNPKLIPVLAEIILELGRNGVQIFLATHDDLLAEYLEYLTTEEDKVAYHALYHTDKGAQCETDKKFTLLEKNAIIDEKINLYRKEIAKGLE